MALTAGKHNVIRAGVLQIMFRDSNGYPQGQDTTPDAKSSPQTDNAYVVEGLVDFNEGNTVYSSVTNLAAEGIRNNTPVAASDYGTPTFTLSEEDETLNSFINASTIDVATNTAGSWRGENVTRTTFPTFMVVMSAQVTLESSTEYWDHWIFPSCTIIRSAGTGAGQVTGDVTNPNPFAYELKLALATRDVTGYLFSATAMALNGNKDARIKHRTLSRVGYTTWTADGTATTFVLGFRPTSSDATGAVENNVTNDGIAQSVTSIATATGLVTVSAAGDDGDIYVVEYATDFVAI